MLFSATWRQKSQKIDFMNVFHGFIGFGSETANIFNTCMAQGAYIVQYIVNSCRGCWQYTISIVAGIKNNIYRDPYLRRGENPKPVSSFQWILSSQSKIRCERTP